MNALKFLNNLFGKEFPDFSTWINESYAEIQHGFFLYGIIGFLIAVIVLLVVNKVERFKPKTKKARVFNSINFFYLPILFFLSFGGYGGLDFADKYARSQVHNKIIPVIQVAFPTFQLYISGGWNSLKKDEATFEDAVYRFTSMVDFHTDSDSWIEQKKMEVAEVEIPKMIFFGLESVVDQEISKYSSNTKTKLEVAKKMGFLKLGFKFWNGVEQRILEKSKNNFLTKKIRLLGLITIASAFLIIQIILITSKKMVKRE